MFQKAPDPGHTSPSNNAEVWGTVWNDKEEGYTSGGNEKNNPSSGRWGGGCKEKQGMHGQSLQSLHKWIVNDSALMLQAV